MDIMCTLWMICHTGMADLNNSLVECLPPELKVGGAIPSVHNFFSVCGLCSFPFFHAAHREPDSTKALHVLAKKKASCSIWRGLGLASGSIRQRRALACADIWHAGYERSGMEYSR